MAALLCHWLINVLLVCILQSAAETACDMVSPGPSVVPGRHGRHRLANQPADLREGVANAYHMVTEVWRMYMESLFIVIKNGQSFSLMYSFESSCTVSVF